MNFLNDDILLTSPLAKELYSLAKELPIIDYHCHIDAKQILNDKKFENITQLWLCGDHYKWRLMRNCGVEEKYITGGASDYEKFEAFAKCLPHCIGNPIYIWCHMELKKYFDYSGEINQSTARQIFDMTAQKLNMPQYSVRNIIKRSNVEVICTTDDPIDDLQAHKELAKQNLPFKVLPSFRPDRAVHIERKDFSDYITKLSDASGIKINNAADLKAALNNRLEYFYNAGCRVSDHALDNYIYADCGESEADNIFSAALGGGSLTDTQIEQFQTYMLMFLAQRYSELGIAMQLHFCCLRNNNTAMFERLGADSGFDSINSSLAPHKLVKLSDGLAQKNALPKTIIYSLDPNDDKLINSVINCFQQSGVRGKLQHGSAWWFNDTKYGMKSHLKTLAEYSVLGNFIGMLTDSRSFTSYIRHDYFRRLLCDFIAKQVGCGEYPENAENLKMLVKNICYENVKKYIFG